MSGAYCSLKDLLGLRFQARDLPLFHHTVSRSLMAGGARSPFKGRGVDFEEVRAYQFGDDIRTIDWRVTAPTHETSYQGFSGRTGKTGSGSSGSESLNVFWQ